MPIASGAADLLPPIWYIIRAAGAVAYLYLWLSVLLGLLVSARLTLPLLNSPALVDLHQTAGAWGLYTGLFHGLLLHWDGYMPFALREILLPGAARYEPVWTALGVYAMYAGGAVYITSLLRRRLGQQLWRWFHYLSLVAYFLALVHGVALGTDTAAAWAQVMYWTTASLLAFALLLRFRPGSRRAAPPEGPASGGESRARPAGGG